MSPWEWSLRLCSRNDPSEASDLESRMIARLIISRALGSERIRQRTAERSRASWHPAKGAPFWSWTTAFRKRLRRNSAARRIPFRRGFLHGLGVLAVAASALAEPRDPVAALDERIRTGQEALTFHPRWGYLPSLLDGLGIPRSSQLLVFSKTSAQFRWITAHNPRAIYFNDETYVGWVPGGPMLEISTAVPGAGAAFYTLSQRRQGAPRLVLDNGACLQCHESARTLGVPGHLTRSVFPAMDGLPHFSHGTVNVDHSTPVDKRWGGWFVSGSIPMSHRGNAVGKTGAFTLFSRGDLARPYGTLFDRDRYLTPYSDVVAHLVLAHQTRVHNAIARAGIEANRAITYQDEMTRLFGLPSESLLASVKRRIERPAEQLVRDLLMVQESSLTGPIRGDSGFTEHFEARDSPTTHHDPLRQLDLQSRLFRLRCSFLIRSRAYRALPDRVRSYVRERLTAILSAEDDTGMFGHLGTRERGEIREILEQTLSAP